MPTGDAPAAAFGLVEGTELLGQYDGSGRTQAPYLIRRIDGRMLEVSPLLYLVAIHLRGAKDVDDIARHVGIALGRPVSAASVSYLIEHKLMPLGIVFASGRATFDPPAVAPVLTMTVRAGVVPKHLVRRMTAVLRPLFLPPVVVAAIAGLLAVDCWVLMEHDAGRAVHDLMLQPALLLALVGITLAGAFFHELGHATASRYGGAEPGVIGVGIYLMWPVFYNDLNDSYRLSRRARLRADLGGVYFNAVFILFLAALYGATGFRPLLVAVVAQHFAIGQQFVPFLRLDGYYVVSDLAGVPDLFGRIRPILSTLVRRGRPASALSDLTPRARAIVTVWAVATVPLLGGLTVLVLTALPDMIAGAGKSVGIQGDILVAAVGDAAPVRALASAVQIVILAVPFVGLSGLLLRVARRCRRRGRPAVAAESGRDRAGLSESPAARRNREGRPGSTPVLVAACVVLLVAWVASDIRSRFRQPIDR